MLHAKCSITGNKHSTLESAEEACKNDKRCDGLLLQQCEKDGDYHICLNNGTIEYGTLFLRASMKSRYEVCFKFF